MIRGAKPGREKTLTDASSRGLGSYSIPIIVLISLKISTQKKEKKAKISIAFYRLYV